MKTFNYDLLDEYKKQNTERAHKLSFYQEAVTEAKSRLAELQTQYEYTFTQAVAKGEDKTAELAQIDDDIALQKEVVARRERDYNIASQALPVGEITSVDVVTKYRTEFIPKVQAEYKPIVQAKLDLARDLLKSALIDHHTMSNEYSELETELKEMSKANHSTGKTRYWEGTGHPTKNVDFYGRQGVPAAISELFQELVRYSLRASSVVQDVDADFYIDAAPKNNKTKAGK